MSNLTYAEQIIRAVGKANIINVTHCATRLRFVLVDNNAVNIDALEAIECVKGSVSIKNEFQVFMDISLVTDIYEEIQNLLI